MSRVLEQIYPAGSRPSIPAEHLLRISLLVAYYTICTERRVCGKLRYKILIKLNVNLNFEDEPFK